MDIEIARRKAEITKRQEQMKRQLKAHTEAAFEMSREQLARNNELMGVLNDDLQTLKLEFELQEIGQRPSSFFELSDNNRKTCCCGTCPTSLPQNSKQSCTLEDLNLYFRVSSPEDFQSKHEQLGKRLDSLSYCNLKCFHLMGYGINYWTSDCDETKVATVIGIIIYIVFIVPVLLFCFTCAPATWVYGCCQGCLNSCYRRESRTSRIWEVYQKYEEMLSP